MLASGFNVLSFVEAVAITLCIIGMYWFRPWESAMSALISGIWLIIGLVAVSYGFFYPHFYLSAIISDEKHRQSHNIQRAIDSLLPRLTMLCRPYSSILWREL